jgi:hypothetical protein
LQTKAIPKKLLLPFSSFFLNLLVTPEACFSAGIKPHFLVAYRWRLLICLSFQFPFHPR